jgi:hypothetical protein
MFFGCVLLICIYLTIDTIYTYTHAYVYRSITESLSGIWNRSTIPLV